MSPSDHPSDGSIEDPREQHMRDLLREAAGQDRAGPPPPEVVARLEDTLAGLVAEQQAGLVSQEHTARPNVVPLRPRWMPRLAAGAAAVIVLGLGGYAVANLDVFGQDGLAGGGSGGSAAQSEADDSDTAGSGGDSAGGGSTVESPEALAPSEAAGDEPDAKTQALLQAPAVSSARFDQDVASLLRQQPPLRSSARTRDDTDQRDLSASPSLEAGQYAARVCPGPQLTDGSRTTPIVLDGTPAVLVVRPSAGASRAVEAWSCDGSARLAQGTVGPRR